MVHTLIQRRDQLMERADRALDTAWPDRTSPEFVKESVSCISEMELLATQMRTANIDPVEQSYTFRLLGALYADLAPARGADMLLKAVKYYSIAENLLLGQGDELERAKLNFNCANALRQLDPNNVRQLEEAKQRFLSARGYFATNSPEYLKQIDAGLQSVSALLRIAPLAADVEKNNRDIKAIGKKLASDGNVAQSVKDMHDLMDREGGAAGLIGRLKNILEGLPGDQKQGKKYAQLKSQFEALSEQALGEKLADSEGTKFLSALRQRLESELVQGRLTGDRADTIKGMLQLIENRIKSKDDETLVDIMETLQGIRNLADGWIDMLHYPSYDLPRPPVGSRAATLVELCWKLRRFLAEEMNRSGKGPDETKTAFELSMRATSLDKRLYEVGEDNERAAVVEKEDLRPLAVAVRDYSALKQPMLAYPIWSAAKLPVATNEVFYSGLETLIPKLSNIVRNLGLQLQTQVRGESPAEARWTQLQMAMTTIFDLRAVSGPALTSVTYELGIALTLGKPIVVLVGPDQSMPFDVNIAPLVLTDTSAGNAALESAIDQSLVWLYPRLDVSHVAATIDFVLTRYPRPNANLYADQTLRLLSDNRVGADPVTAGNALAKLIDFLEGGKPMLIHPVWSPAYPSVDTRSLFHVMPFRPDWANDVHKIARKAVKASGGIYVRGDEVKDPNVISSIWANIAQASHVLVDLTGFNPNVALELGIAHTLGRKVCLVCQGEPDASAFPSISKLRIESYDMKKLDKTLAAQVKAFVST